LVNFAVILFTHSAEHKLQYKVLIKDQVTPSVLCCYANL